MKKSTKTQPVYYVFGIAIAALLGLIVYFSYLLLMPSNSTNTNNNKTNSIANTNTVKNTNAKANKNGNENANDNSNSNSNTNTNANVNVNNTNTDEGFVEPTNSNSNQNTNTSSNTNTTKVVAKEGEEVITLYFSKAGADCGEVFPVERAVTPTDDLYGQIVLANMAGPSDEETGYTSAIPGDLRLRWVEYTADGPMVYVNEAFEALDDCEQKTAKAQLLSTANTMFEVKNTSAGDVVVGYPEEQEPDVETTE